MLAFCRREARVTINLGPRGSDVCFGSNSKAVKILSFKVALQYFYRLLRPILFTVHVLSHYSFAYLNVCSYKISLNYIFQYQ